MKTEQLNVDPRKLTPYENNPRSHSEEQIQQIGAAIKKVGFLKPVVIDENDMILAGHGAVEAAKSIDLESIPAHRVKGLSEEQKRAYILADNRLAEKSQWDIDLLALELNDLREVDFELDLIGFSENEIINILLPRADGTNDASKEWTGMPEFQQGDEMPHRTIHVHFKNDKDAEKFAELVGQEITEKTKFMWFPHVEPTKVADKEYADEGELKQITVKGIKAIVREGTSDSFVVEEVIKSNEYRKLKIQPQDVVLDLGMNIGMFSVWAANQGASVHGFEADPDNFTLAVQNIDLNGFRDQCFALNKAITGTDDETRDFSVNGKKNKGAHSLVAKRGRDTITVAAENINAALKRIKPTIVKMDIEGGEIEVLNAVESFEGVKQFIMEFHHDHLNDKKTGKLYKETIALLKKHFKTVDYREETKQAWTSIVYCAND